MDFYYYSCLQEKQNGFLKGYILLAPLFGLQETNFLKFYALEYSWSHQNHMEDVKRESFQSQTLHSKKNKLQERHLQESNFPFQQLTRTHAP